MLLSLCTTLHTADNSCFMVSGKYYPLTYIPNFYVTLFCILRYIISFTKGETEQQVSQSYIEETHWFTTVTSNTCSYFCLFIMQSKGIGMQSKNKLENQHCNQKNMLLQVKLIWLKC